MSTKLKRAISLPGLIFYGVGTMIGGGIYALLGKVTAEAGMLTPWAMLLAGIMALFSALTFAELSSRFPFSSGPAYYITQAWQNETLGRIFGWLVIATGVVSSATLTVAVSGFILDIILIPTWITQLLVIALLCIIACWGIQQSVVVVAIITLIEVAGLILVIMMNGDSILHPSIQFSDLMPAFDFTIWQGIIVGSFLAFYAFIGFEDLVTLAEEVKGAESNLPKGIIISMLITLLLYIAISYVAVVSTDLTAFSESHTPMASLIHQTTWISPMVLVFVSLLAGLNGALVQVVMASRVLFGMADNQQAPVFFAKIHPVTRTPIIASIAVAIIILLLAWLVDLTTLAKITSGIILLVFSGINLALFWIKRTQQQHTGFNVPIWIPVIGFLLSFSSLWFALFSQISASH